MIAASLSKKKITKSSRPKTTSKHLLRVCLFCIRIVSCRLRHHRRVQLGRSASLILCSLDRLCCNHPVRRPTGYCLLCALLLWGTLLIHYEPTALGNHTRPNQPPNSSPPSAFMCLFHSLFFIFLLLTTFLCLWPGGPKKNKTKQSKAKTQQTPAEQPTQQRSSNTTPHPRRG